jgi:hypothetical protein
MFSWPTLFLQFFFRVIFFVLVNVARARTLFLFGSQVRPTSEYSTDAPTLQLAPGATFDFNAKRTQVLARLS